MPTTTSPPVLIWQPEGGIPGGSPISNPPVYSQADVTPLVAGQAYVDVVFGSVQTDTTWVLVECDVVNTLDLAPLNIWPGIITDRTAAGFRLQLNGMPDSGNYYLHWAVSGINITPVAATSYQLTGPSSGPYDTFGAHSSNFTVKLPPSTILSGTITVTPDDGGAGGTFTPATVTLTSAVASATFTYTPASYGAKTISVTNSGTLTDPASITFTAVAVAYTLSGPGSGTVSVPSTNFTVALPAGGVVVSSVTITPNDSSGGGTFTPATVNLTTGAPSATFTYTPASTGTKTISTTNNGGLINPSNLSYTVSAPFDPSSITGLKGWFKADALVLADGASVSAWADSSGTGHDVAQATGGAQPIFKTGIVNGKPVVRFDGVNDVLVAGTPSIVGDFSVFVVYQTSGDSIIIGAASGFNQLFRVGESGFNKYSAYDGTSVSSSTLAALRTAWNLGCFTRSGVTVSFFEAGVARGTGTTGGASDGLGVIGGLPGASTFMTGDVAEILLYDSQLGTTDRQNVENYLKAKYGIA